MFIKLIVSSYKRAKLRNFFTYSTFVIAFVLLGLLLSLNRVFTQGAELADANQLIVANRMSIMQPIPATYVDRVKDLEQIELAVPFTFFGGFYREPDQQILSIATEPRDFVKLIDEVNFRNEKDLVNWFSNIQGVAVGRTLAEKYDWHVGELISLYSLIYPRKNGSNSWTFEVAAIFDSEDETGNTESLLIHNEYFNLNRLYGEETVGWINIKIKHANDAAKVVDTIDRLFANSLNETKTSTEAAFTQEFMKQVGDFSLLISLAISLVFFTLLLVIVNAFGQSVNERKSEFATLRAIGFSRYKIGALVMSESVVMAMAGGLTGFIVAYISIPWLSERSELLKTMVFELSDIGIAILSIALLSIASGLKPSIEVMRSHIAIELGKGQS